MTARQEAAARLAQSIRDGLAAVERRTSPFAKPTIALIVDRTPGTLRDLYMATDGGFLPSLSGSPGANRSHKRRNPGKRDYAKLSKEDLLAIDPDVILDLIHGSQSKFVGDPMAPWSEMPELKAVRARHVYGVNEDYVPHASQRVIQTAELFARLIHPEAK